MYIQKNQADKVDRFYRKEKDCALKVARESIRLIIDDVDTISTGRVKEWEDWFSSLGHGSYAKAAAALTKTSTRLRRSAYVVSGVLFVFSSVCNIFELLLTYTYSSYSSSSIIYLNACMHV